MDYLDGGPLARLGAQVDVDVLNTYHSPSDTNNQHFDHYFAFLTVFLKI